MITIIDHGERFIRRVRDEDAETYIACVPCKGTGTVNRFRGSIGNLWYDGWEISAWSECWCGHCFGKGAWRSNPPHVSQSE